MMIIIIIIKIIISHEKANSEASAKSKEVKGKPNKINELVLNTKIDLEK